MGCTSDGDPIQEMWYRDRIIARDDFGRKIKSTGLIYLPGSKLLKSEDNLSMGSCLQDAVINSAPSIEKYINKIELYRKCTPRRAKNTKKYEIENA